MAVRRFHYLAWQSDLGPLTAISSSKGLGGLFFGSPDLMKEAGRLAGGSSWELLTGPDPVLDSTRDQVEEFLTGGRKVFDLGLDMVGTEFQRQVWQALTEIPFGQIVTYGQLAQKLGRPKAFRAVGSANGANPISIIVPCHRVVSTTGLGGYGGGLPIKRLLLGIEGVTSGDVREAGKAATGGPGAGRRLF
jgi:methylated-DNA-[protein]-cysteine S-methyltransferase